MDDGQNVIFTHFSYFAADIVCVPDTIRERFLIFQFVSATSCLFNLSTFYVISFCCIFQVQF